MNLVHTHFPLSLLANNVENNNIIEHVRWAIYSSPSTMRFYLLEFHVVCMMYYLKNCRCSVVDNTSCNVQDIADCVFHFLSLSLFSPILSCIHSHFGSVVVTVKWREEKKNTTQRWIQQLPLTNTMITNDFNGCAKAYASVAFCYVTMNSIAFVFDVHLVWC